MSKKSVGEKLKEQVNELIINFEHMVEKRNNLIQFTSVKESENKTKLIVLLARKLAQKNRSVAVLDFNLRDPKLSVISKNDTNKGIVNILKDKKPYENEIIKDLYENNLDMIIANSKVENPISYFESDYCKNFLHLIASNYDYVLIDSPSNMKFADANLISTMVDKVIIVFDLDKTTVEQLEISQAKINKLSGNVMGVIGVK